METIWFLFGKIEHVLSTIAANSVIANTFSWHIWWRFRYGRHRQKSTLFEEKIIQDVSYFRKFSVDVGPSGQVMNEYQYSDKETQLVVNEH